MSWAVAWPCRARATTATWHTRHLVNPHRQLIDLRSDAAQNQLALRQTPTAQNGLDEVLRAS
jgi:hypothetical protein